MAGRVIVGIAGGSGSGKTTFSQQVRQRVGAEFVTTVHHDSYYRDLSHLSEKRRAASNFDDPQALESELLVQHVRGLLSGRHVESPRYDFNTHSRHANGATLEPRPIILIEGVLIFTDPSLREICNLRIFVDAAEELRFERRLARDREQRGRTDESIRDQWRQTVKPMHDRYVEPSKHWAHVIVPAAEPNQTAVELVGRYLHAELSSRDE